jgi:SAM-dependent methyltransferase
MPMPAELRARLRALYAAAPRDEYFAAAREAIRDYYLAEPSNPYRQSGRSSGAERWLQTRRCIARAVHRGGDFLDVGCANGLLLESLIQWTGERGFTIRPHGIDFVPELVALARQRLAPHRGSFAVANAFCRSPAPPRPCRRRRGASRRHERNLVRPARLAQSIHFLRFAA